MIPQVTFTRIDGNTGVVLPSEDGVACIIAPSEKGTQNQPETFTRSGDIRDEFGAGPLAPLAAYVMLTSKKPVMVIRAIASTAGTTSAVTFTGTGTSVVTATGAAYDDFNILVTTKLGGTIATGPITFNYSLDGGLNTSADISLGTANTYLVPGTNVTLHFAAGTLVAGDTAQVYATAPQITSSDLLTALEALRVTGSPWECVFVASCAATSTIVADLDTWLSGLEATGKFRWFAANSLPRAVGQSEAAYLTAMTTAYASVASVRGIVGGDVADMANPYSGFVQPRPAVAYAVARAMGNDIAVEPAWIALGNLPSCSITDQRNNPVHHNEELFPGLDDIRLTTLRSVAGKIGVFIDNTNVISTPGSDYVYLPHVRVMNTALEIAFQILTTELSRGVPKNLKPDPTTGKVFIQEPTALEIEGLVQVNFSNQLGPTRVSASSFKLSRTDDLGSNAGARLTGTVEIEALAYVKGIAITAKFVRTISVAA